MNKFKALPSIDRLKEVFYIDEDGVLRWARKPHLRCKHINAGDAAGSITDTGYLRVCLDKETYYCHRIIWKIQTGFDPGQMEVDHINRNPLDNRIENLRLATTWQNSLNRTRTPKNKTGEQCVFTTGRKRSPFKVVISNKHVGSFSSIEEAVWARDSYKRLVWGEG
jgi:hypothetical protein